MEEQATIGLSLDAQEARITAYAIAMASMSDVVQGAGVSAKTLLRPGVGKSLDDVRAGKVERVIILMLEHITRSARDLAELLETFAQAYAALMSVSESPDTKSAAGGLVVNQFGVVAQWEREAIGERTATALSHKRATSQAYGPTPFGYRRDGKALVPEAAEQAALPEELQLEHVGASFRAIGRALTDLGVKPHRGAAWHASSVRAVLRSKMVAV